MENILVARIKAMQKEGVVIEMLMVKENDKRVLHEFHPG